MKKKVKVEMSGGFRIAGVLVENMGFSFRNPSHLKSTKTVELIAPISVHYQVKGKKYTSFTIAITINKVTHKINGTVTSSKDPERGSVNFSFKDFNLR